jgi:hypothetical protein
MNHSMPTDDDVALLLGLRTQRVQWPTMNKTACRNPKYQYVYRSSRTAVCRRCNRLFMLRKDGTMRKHFPCARVMTRTAHAPSHT